MQPTPVHIYTHARLDPLMQSGCAQVAMDPVVERKFKNLRRRLDQLGYRQPLGLVCFGNLRALLPRFLPSPPFLIH